MNLNKPNFKVQLPEGGGGMLKVRFDCDYRMQGHFSPPHLHVSELFVERGKSQWSLLSFNKIQTSGPVFCSLR